MANETTTATAAAVNPAIIQAGAAATASAMRVFRPLITEYPFAGPGKTLDLITIDSVTATAYTESNARTFTTGDPTAITLTPAEIDVAMAFTDKERKRSLIDLPQIYGEEVGRAVAVKMDADVAALQSVFTGTTTDEGDTVASVAKLLTAIGVVRQAAKDQVGAIGVVMHTNAWDALITDSNVINAQVRGGSQGLFSGSFELIGGGSVSFTTAIESSATPIKYQNMIFTKRAIALAWKTLLEVDVWDDRDIKSIKLGAGADYDVAMRFAGEGATYTVTV